MEQEQKGLVLSFLDVAYENGYIRDEVKEEKEKFWKILLEVSELIPKALYNRLEQSAIDLEDYTKHRYFEFGTVASEVSEQYDLMRTPFKKAE